MTKELDRPAQLKDWFNAGRIRQIADGLAQVYPAADPEAFIERAGDGLDALTLLERLRRTTEALHAALPPDFAEALPILRRLAPTFRHNFVSLVLPDYVGLYGRQHFDESLAALKFFTPFGSSEFAIREFLRLDQDRTLATMELWSRDQDEHVRRLASEGCRPRLPWSFRLARLVSDPAPVAPILENLRADPSLYVRKSVANHLNDISKDHPAWVIERLRGWDLDHPHTAWIARQALRTLIKRGDRRALALIGAGTPAEAVSTDFRVHPERLQLGEVLVLNLTLSSGSARAQVLEVDYSVHYVKRNGETSPKVFKWKHLTLPPGGQITLSRRQCIRDFSTRKHFAGLHRVEVQVNGERRAAGAFMLDA